MMLKTIATAIAPLRRQPANDAPLDSELLFGERVDVVTTENEWHCVRSVTDGYEGFLPTDTLAGPTSPTHVIASAGSFVYRDADLKSPVLMRLDFLSAVEVDRQDGDYYHTALGYLHRATLKPVGGPACADPVQAARLFLNVPYKWGGRSSLGLDCSALIQLSYAACGVALPRDSGPQRRISDDFVTLDRLAAGDLVFSPGHVMLATSPGAVIHASGFHMRVVEEPLDTALGRLAPAEREQAVAKPGPLRHDP